MIELIYGKKGSGKTKRIIASANEAVRSTKDGCVVFIDDNSRYMYDLDRNIRFVATENYGLHDAESLYHFICGGTAVNYGIEYLYIDGLKKIVNTDLASLEGFFSKLNTLSDQNGFRVVMTISAEPEEMPDFLKAYIR
ncbi:MAG: hypothetical protein KIG36_03155 [Eubacteriales bacterium]|nr:hypothetical protein [Eubacteriales bacterium]